MCETSLVCFLFPRGHWKSSGDQVSKSAREYLALGLEHYENKFAREQEKKVPMKLEVLLNIFKNVPVDQKKGP